MVYFCYFDESGNPDIAGNTSHYVLSGLSVPINKWKYCDREISSLKAKFHLENSEIHTAWILRKYLEQSKIAGFEQMNQNQRTFEVEKRRNAELIRLQNGNNSKNYHQTKKNFKQTQSYIHLTYAERLKFIQEVADLIGKWSFARIFAECINKLHFNPKWSSTNTIDEQALEQVVSRFEQYLKIVAKSRKEKDTYGVIIHDNNETVSKKHTMLMKKFHKQGTLWTSINKIIETPLFVNSELTGLIQIADLCSYSLRRFFENNDTDLIDRIKSRFDRKDNKFVGIRHFTDDTCQCFICNQECN